MANSNDFTLQTIFDYVLAGMGDPNHKFITHAEITMWWNHYSRDLARRVKLLDTYDSYTWPANTDETSLYTVLSNMYDPTSQTGGTRMNPDIHHVTWKSSTKSLQPLVLSKSEVWLREPDRDYLSDKGEPERFYYDPSTLKCGMQPTPDVSGTLTVYYTFVPRPLNSTNVTQAVDYMFEPWFGHICSAVISTGMRKDRDHFPPDEADRQMAYYEQGIALAALDKYRKSHRGNIINFVRDYNYPS